MEAVKVKQIRDALNHIVNENAEFIVRDNALSNKIKPTIHKNKIVFLYE